MTKRQLLASGAALICMALSHPASAQVGSTVAEVLVRARDKAKLLEQAPSDTVFGLDKPLIDTARAATFISDVTLERYGIKSIDGLTAVSPGAYTASFYGVPGALNIRGTLAENYFRGFKRIENRGTYSTPIGDAAQIEIVRGPPTPIYGAGKVGGLLNFIPKSSRLTGGYLTAPEGEITATLGTYKKSGVTGQGSIPLSFGTVEGGLHAYAEYSNDGDYYHGISPEKKLVEASADFNLGNGWRTTFGGMVFRSDGDVQTPGWNRLTQDLINTRTYVTGRDTSVRDLDGNGRLTPNEISPGGVYPFSVYKYGFYFGSPPATDAFHTLDTGVGTTKLSRRTVYSSQQDFSTTATNTGYFEIAKDLADSQSLKFEGFYDDLDNNRFVSYGYPASFQSHVWEARVTYDFAYDAGPLTSKSFVGASYRALNARRRESFNSGLIALDRRDISFGATPTDIIDSPFTTEPAGVTGLGWENDNHSQIHDRGIFATSDIYLWKSLNLTLGARYDDYHVKSQDNGLYSFQPSGKQGASKGKFTYTASLSYKTPWGIMPYYTYAKASALEVSQAGDIAPSLIADNSWLSGSDLNEAGLKYQGLQGTLVASLAAYRQNRTQLIQGVGTTSIQGSKATGLELEIRWLATEHLSFTFAGNNQRTEVKGRAGFSYLPAFAVGVSPVNAFGGAYITFDAGGVYPTLAQGYKYSLIPDTVASLFAAYTSSVYDWGRAGGTVGFTSVSKTSGYVPNAVVLPSFTTVNLSTFYETGPYTVTANIDNLFNKLYFTPLGDSYSNLAVLPGRGREGRVTLKRTF